jgi:Putative rep protein (DUF1424)
LTCSIVDTIPISDEDKIRNFLSDLKLKSHSSNKKNRRTKDFINGVKKEYSLFGQPLNHIPRQFKKCVANFTGYLADTARRTFKITTKQGDGVKDKSIGYIHRWTPVYRRSILAKMYQLENSLTDEEKKNITMITLTTSQRGEDQEECLLKLLKYYNLLLKLLRYHIGTIDYFYMLEPHETGYVHLHLMYMKILTDAEKKIITNAWTKKYGVGVIEGINFSEPKASKDGKCFSGSIKFVRSYLMKYVSKGLHSESMSKGELLFNSLLKKHKIRLWGCSRNFSKIMKRPKKPLSEDYECLKVEMYQDDEFVSLLYPIPKLEELKPTHKYEWVFLQSVTKITDKLVKKIKQELLKLEVSKTEFIDKHGNSSYTEEYLLYEPVLVPLGVGYV